MEQLKILENKYLVKNKDHHVVKLENFKKKIFAVGVKEDYATEGSPPTQDQKLQIAKNALLIRNLIKDVRPESVVVELCQDRFDEHFYDVVSHPNYDRTLSGVHKILDAGNYEKLLEYDQIDMNKGNLEFLVGMDICSYRLPCKTVLGDRDIGITRKRFKSKVKMLDVYKEVTNQENSQQILKPSQTSKNIFEIVANEQNVGESQVSVLKKALQKTKDDKKEEVKEDMSTKLMKEVAERQSSKTIDDIFNEVVIDEINEELIKSAQSCDGDVVVMLMRQERIDQFEKMWKQLNLDYYQTQEHRRNQKNKEKKEEKQLNQVPT